jgi:Ca-activated chloride channel family protein
MEMSGWKESGTSVLLWHRSAKRLFVIFALAGLRIASAQAQDPIMRVDVRLVRVLATVKDASGAPVAALDKPDFAVRDNGVPQEVAVFERRTEQPLSVALLIDNSGSTAKDLKYEVDSVVRFLRSLFREGNPEDAVGLYSFNYQIVQQHRFSRDVSSLERPLRMLRGEAGTALYDAIYLASEELQRRQGRRVMVIVTDGGDTVSNKDFHAALEAAQLADCAIYPILVVPIENDAGRNIGGENALTNLARGTGGQVFVPTLGSAIDQAFEQIIRALRTQYFLGYYPRNVPLTKDRFHRIDVRVNGADLQVLARSGYYGDSTAETSNPADRIFTKPQPLPPPPTRTKSR